MLVSHPAEMAFNNLIRTYTEHIYDFSFMGLEECGLLKGDKIPYRLSQFNDPYDTLIYSRLIAKAILLSENPELIVDLGCGSSLPTLMAREQTERDIEVMSVDLDPHALDVSRENAEVFGATDSYQFIEGNLETILPVIKKRKGTIIVSNPPYIATPPDLKRHEYLPIDGGPDGSDYLKAILNESYPQDTTLALLWGSLTNPRDIIPAIESRYEIIHFEAYRIHFGHYTSQKEIRNYLEQLRSEGRVHFESIDGRETQLVFGMILKPVQTQSA